jgi:hypothetical protein
MSSKVGGVLSDYRDAIVYVGEEATPENKDGSISPMAALATNIRESLEEIEILRGTVQYWESRRVATDAKERHLLAEAFRIMHGELFGLTARMKELLSKAELTPEA